MKMATSFTPFAFSGLSSLKAALAQEVTRAGQKLKPKLVRIHPSFMEVKQNGFWLWQEAGGL